jgi:anaerobic ribonucleoside-triphosphate reductase activating protein
MYFSYPQVVLQEVPGEISLALSISGCTLNCKGCHSSETFDPKFGEELSLSKLAQMIDRQKHITCVLFYGGEWLIEELEVFIDYVKSRNLKTCLFTGRELAYFSDEFLNKLDFIKVGRYKENLGGLKSEQTNQRFIKLPLPMSITR